MVLGPLNIISVHLLSLLYSSFSELFPIWVACALVIFWPLWPQRKHLHAKILDTGRIFVARKDNYRYRTKMLQWGDSHSLEFLLVSQWWGWPFQAPGPPCGGEGNGSWCWVSWGFMKVTVWLQEAIELGQKCIFSFALSGILMGIPLAREEAGKVTDGGDQVWGQFLIHAVVCRGNVFLEACGPLDSC